jgi:hypothetical protein
MEDREMIDRKAASGSGRMLKTMGPRGGAVERAISHEPQRAAIARRLDKMEIGSITVCLIICEVIVKHQVLDALLFGTLSLLLVDEGNGKVGVCRKIDRASLSRS